MFGRLAMIWLNYSYCNFFQILHCCRTLRKNNNTWITPDSVSPPKARTMDGTGLQFESWTVKKKTQSKCISVPFCCFQKEIWLLKSSCSQKSPSHDSPVYALSGSIHTCMDAHTHRHKDMKCIWTHTHAHLLSDGTMKYLWLPRFPCQDTIVRW